MGEGAGVVVLEEYEHAKARGAKIYAEADRLRPVGRRLSHHRAVRGRRWRVPLHEGGDQARRHYAGRHRLHQRARHLDAARRRDGAWRGRSAWSATRRADISMSSTKSSIGHLLGAAGAVEAIFSLLAIRDNVAPPTINLDNPSVETPIDLVPAQGAQSVTSMWRCPIRSGLAAPMRRWCFRRVAA